MGIKEIFQQGSQEFKRRSAVRKEKRGLEEKQKIYSQQLTLLGKKAWESSIDITPYANLKELITIANKQLEELKTQLDESEKQKQATEETRKQKNEAFDSQRKEVEEKKKDVDSRLGEQKKNLRDIQKVSNDYQNRLNSIAREVEQLNQKAANAQTPEVEKAEIPKKIATLGLEKDELGPKIAAIADSIKTNAEKITPLEEETKKLLDQINAIRTEQKQVIGDLDKAISELKGKINEATNKQKEVNKEQEGYFAKLGENLAGAGVSDPAVAEELAVVKTTEGEMNGITDGISKLDQAITPEAQKAYKSMIGIIVGGVIAIVVIIVLLVVLL